MIENYQDESSDDHNDENDIAESRSEEFKFNF